MDIKKLSRMASVGSFVVITTSDKSNKSGIISDIDESDGSIIIDTDQGPEWINCSCIDTFRGQKTINASHAERKMPLSSKDTTELLSLPHSGGQLQLSAPEMKGSDGNSSSIVTESISVQGKSNSTENNVHTSVIDIQVHNTDKDKIASNSLSLQASQDIPSPTITKLYDNDLIKLHFLGKPHLEFPQPEYDFNITSNKEILKLVNSCKSKFENALKIKECFRLTPCIADFEKTAQNVNSLKIRGYLLYLAGVFSHYGTTESQAYSFLEESYFKCNFKNSAFPLAALEIQKGNYEKACGPLALAIKQRKGKDSDELVRTLGQCIMQLPERLHLPIGCIVDIENLSSETLDLGWMLIYYLLQDDEEACIAIEQRDIELLRKCKAGNDIFPWESENESEIDEDELVDKYSKEGITRRGRISAYYTERNMGFLIEAQTGQTWYFNKDSILDAILIDALSEGRRGQEVSFFEKEMSLGKYPAAYSIHLRSSVDTEYSTTLDTKAPLEVRLRALPKNSSYYAKAKASEQYGDLAEAEKYYQLEINRGGIRSNYFKSAIKDLASLYNRKNQSLEAIALLDKYVNLFESSDIRSLNQMKVTFFLKAKKYEEAAQLLQDLAKGLLGYSEKRTSYLQQEAYCYYAMGQFDIAIKKLEKLAKTSHSISVSELLEKVKEAKETGNSPENEIAEIFEDRLSELAILKLESCNYEGVDVRSLENNSFTEDDIGRVKALDRGIFGKRPFEHSKYALTLAKLTQELDKPASETNRYLLEYFGYMAEATIYVNLVFPVDVARCYAIEALRLGQQDSNLDTIHKAWTILLSTYNSEEMIQPKNLLNNLKYKTYKDSLIDEVHFLFKNTKSWNAFVKDYSLIYSKTRRVVSVLKDVIEKEGGMLPTLSDIANIETPRQKVAKLFSNFNDFDSLVTDRFYQIRDYFLNSRQWIESLSDLDKSRINDLTKLLDDYARYTALRAFSSKDILYHQLRESIDFQVEESINKPTSLTIEKVYPALNRLRELLDVDFDKLKKQKANLKLTSVLDFYSIEPDGKISVKLELEFADESAPPIEAIRFFIADKDRDYDDAFYPEPFGTGKKEYEFRFKPTEQEISEGVLSLPVSLQYRSRTSDKEIAGPFSISIRLIEPITELIDNPYRKYASGTPVDENDKKMFFGRDELVQEISFQLSEKYSGHCFVLYGQKRSGKTSVLRQVGGNIPKDSVYTYISAQNFNYDGKNALIVFVKMLLYELKKVLKL